MRSSLPLPLASQLAHIEPSWLQYIATEFREFLNAEGEGGFDLGDIPLIQQIYERLAFGGEIPDAVLQDLRRQRRKLRVVAVTSGKGGVGKTTVAVNLAVAFAQQGSRVLLVDADLGMANVHVYAGVQPRGTLLDLVDGSRTLAQLVTPGPGGIHVLCGPSGIARAADLEARHLDHLATEIVRGCADYDVLLLDTGAGISAQVMKFLAMAEEIVVVATPNLASTLDAYGVVKVIRETRLPGRIQILVNHADGSGQAEAVLGRITACARQFLQFTPSSLGFLMRDLAVESSTQNRQPLVLAAPEHENARRLLAVAQRLLEPEPAPEPEATACTVAA
jgi:flagellar biosynthesis protein FlhG